MKSEAKTEECTRESSEKSAALTSKPDDEMIIDPAGVFARRWNELFLAASIVSLFIDPLFLMVPEVKQDQYCIADGLLLQLNLTCIRSVTDLFYLINIVVRFRTAYVEPSSRVLGRGELVLDPWKIALRYLRFNFWVDVAALLPLPQGYILSATARLDEYIIERNDTEQWMHHRQLPQDLRECIRKHDRYRWVATQGIDEEGLLQGLPPDLRRQIKRHLCLDLVLRVPLFNQMDDRLLDTICERLKPRLYTEGTLLISEGEPLTEMLFIVRGYLYSYTTGGGRAGFYNSSEVGPGDFCFEQLLTWALDPPLDCTLPASTFTIKTITDVEAFVLEADDLKFAALQFNKLHSRELKHTLRFYSCQWRTWAACYIQAAWRRHKKRKLIDELNAKESSEEDFVPGNAYYDEMEVFVPRPDSGVADYAARIVAYIRRGSSNRFGPDSYVLRSITQYTTDANDEFVYNI